MKRAKRDRAQIEPGSATPASRRAMGDAAEVEISATDVQNEFGRVLDRAVGDDVVVITRHNVPRAVLMSVDRYRALARGDTRVLDTLSAQFDVLLREMQRPETSAGIERGFAATADEMGRAAVAALRRQRSRSRSRGG